MQTERRNIVICPSCGAENIEGADTCENCLSDLRSLDVPAAYQVAPHTELTRQLKELRLSKAVTIPQSATVREALATLKSDASGAVIVMDGDRVVGIFTDRDVLNRVAANPAAVDAPLVAHMTPDPVVLQDFDTMAAALNKMGDGGYRHVPVLREGRLVAVVTSRDVMQWLLGRYFDQQPE